MAARKLRSVPEPKATPEPVAPQSITVAASSGDRRALLVALRDRVAKSVEDVETPARDLAALSRRLMEIAKDIADLDLADGEDAIGQAALTPDEAWDESSI